MSWSHVHKHISTLVVLALSIPTLRLRLNIDSVMCSVHYIHKLYVI